MALKGRLVLNFSRRKYLGAPSLKGRPKKEMQYLQQAVSYRRPKKGIELHLRKKRGKRGAQK